MHLKIYSAMHDDYYIIINSCIYSDGKITKAGSGGNLRALLTLHEALTIWAKTTCIYYKYIVLAQLNAALL